MAPRGNRTSSRFLPVLYTHELLLQDEERWGAVCVCKYHHCCLFSPVPLSRMRPRTRVPQSTRPPPFLRPRCSFHANENAVFLLLYQMTRKCVTLTLEDKLPPKYLQSAPLTLVRKCKEEGGSAREEREGELRRRRACGQIKYGGAASGFQVLERLVDFDTAVVKVISGGVRKHFCLTFIMAFLVSPKRQVRSQNF